jgi:hypothetical protein
MCRYDLEGNKAWKQTYGWSGYEGAYGADVDSEENLYVVGYLNTPERKNDFLILRRDENGVLTGQRFLWSIKNGSYLYDDVAYDVAVHGDYTYTVGYARAPFMGPPQIHYGNTDIVIVCLEKFGTQNTKWIRQIGTAGNDGAYSVAVDDTGIYVAGHTSELLGQQKYGVIDIVVMKYNFEGEQQWIRQYGSQVIETYPSIDVGPSGVYLSFNTFGAVGGPNMGDYDAVFLRLSKLDGTIEKIKQFGTYTNDYVRGISVDSLENVYLSGYTGGAFPGQVNKGGSDGFIMVLDKDGNQIALSQFGTELSDAVLGSDLHTSPILCGWTLGAFPGQTPGGGEEERDAFLASGTLMETNTPPGTTIKVTLPEAELVFDEVTEGGVTTADQKTLTPEENQIIEDMGYSIVAIKDAMVTEIETTAQYSGTISVSQAYDPAKAMKQEELIKLARSVDKLNWEILDNTIVYPEEDLAIASVAQLSYYTPVLPKDPEFLIDSLAKKVDSLNLQQGLESSFDAKLSAAKRSLEHVKADRRQDAVHELEAFKNAVEAQRGKELTTFQADDLRDDANMVIMLIQQ